MRQAGPFKAVEVFKSPDSKWVIMFHGYGADAHDLAGLVDFFNFNNKTANWLFPNGPLSVPIGPGFTGSAWWNIKLSELPGDWTELRPPGLEEAVQKVFKMFSNMKFDWENVIIGGFSQGAMLATEVYLRAPQKPAGLICLSGTLLSQPLWAEHVVNRAGEKVLISHGESDPVLPHKGSLLLQKFFENHQVKTQFVSFKGGHEIPMPLVGKMKSYISERL